MQRHNAAVAAIAKQAAQFHKTQKPWRIYHGSTNSTRKQNFDRSRVIDTSKLNNIIDLNHEAKTCLVEPNVPMDAIVKATIPHKQLPPVVPEFPGITAGGAYSGTAGESSSFRHGFFDQTVNWIEMVLPNGQIVKCSRDEHADLFYGSAGAFGTLGIITALELRLQPVGEFVELNFHYVRSPEEAVALQLDMAKDKSIWYIDGILFSASNGVVVTGRDRASRSPDEQVQRFTRPFDPWFYQYAETVANKMAASSSDTSSDTSSKSKQATPHKILVPQTDYLFRYDRGAFWMGRHGFRLFNLPMNKFTRFLVHGLTNTRNMYAALHHSGYVRRFIIQDLLIPAEGTAEFINWQDKNLGIYPLWLCPIRAQSGAPLHTWPKAQGELLVNVGLWGAKHDAIDAYKSHEMFLKDNRDIEAKTMDLGGRKWPYAHVFLDESTFWSGYTGNEKSRYDALRRKYSAEWLPTLYDKVRFNENAPGAKESYTEMGAVKGVLNMILRRDHLFK